MGRQIDENGITIGSGISADDGITLLPLLVDPVTNKLIIKNSGIAPVVTTIDRAKLDENRQNTLYGVSNIDGVTLVPIRTDNNGNLLISF